MDRWILLITLGIFLISFAYTATTIQKQNLVVINNRHSDYEQIKTETLQLKMWRRHHETQMFMMKQILQEMRKLSYKKASHPTM